MGAKNHKQPAPKRAPTLRDKVIASTVFIAAVALFYYLTNLPAAIDLGPSTASLEAGPADEVVMAGADTGGLFLAFEGDPSDTVDVRFDRARLHPETTGELNALGLTPPDIEGKIDWITLQGRKSQTFIQVRQQPPSSAQGEVNVLPLVAAGPPSLMLRGNGVGFEVEMAVPLDPTGDPSSAKQLNVEAFTIRKLPGAFPIKVVVPDQSPFVFQFSAAPKASSFQLGGPSAADSPPGIAVRAAGVRPKQPGADYAFWACAAPRGAVSWVPRAVRAGECRATSPLVRVTKLDLNTDRLKLELSGTGFVVKDGTPVTDDWLSKLENNKLLAALLALIYATLARWVWKAFTGKAPES